MAARMIYKCKNKHALGVCYLHTHNVQTRTGETRQQFLVLAYKGKATKQSFYESYMSEEKRNQRVAEFFAGLESHQATQAEYRAERMKPHTLKVGEVLYGSWGYEQTNCEFWEIIAVTKNGATLRQLGQEEVPGSQGFMSEKVVAKVGQFYGPAVKVRVSGYNTCKIEHCHLSKWDGQPKYQSHYA